MFLNASLNLFLINFGGVLRGYGTPKREAKMQQQESTVWESFWHQFLKGLDKGKKGKKKGTGHQGSRRSQMFVERQVTKTTVKINKIVRF